MSNFMPDLHVRHLVCGLGVILEENIVEWGWWDGNEKRLRDRRKGRLIKFPQ